MHNRALQGIISGKKKYSHLLGYGEPLNDKRNAFENVKVSWLYVHIGSWFSIQCVIVFMMDFYSRNLNVKNEHFVVV